MVCFAESSNWNAAMFCVAIVAVLFGIASEWFRQWWNRTAISLSFQAPEKGPGPYFGCVYWVNNTPNENGAKNAIWVRIMVRNDRKRLARSCQPFLTTIEKKGEDGNYKVVHSDMLQLQWAYRTDKEDPGIDIPGEWEVFADVFQTVEGDSHFLPRTVAQPAAWQRLLNQMGEYRLEVAVSGENIEPQREFVRITWTGEWNKFEIGSGKDGRMEPISWDGSRGTP